MTLALPNVLNRQDFITLIILSQVFPIQGKYSGIFICSMPEFVLCIVELSTVDMVHNCISTQGCMEGSNQGLDEGICAHIRHKLNVNGSPIHTCKYQ